LGIILDQGLGNEYYPFPATVSFDKWYLMEGRYDAVNHSASLYVDGALVGTEGSLSSSANPNMFYLGYLTAWNTDSGFGNDMNIDNFTISSSRVYASTIVEISGDGGTTWTYQSPTALSETSVAITANLPTLTAANYKLRVTNNSQLVAASGDTATAGGAVYTLGGSADTTPPAAPSGLSVS